ncbi:MAG: heme NO-binding domain-containing protein [Prolixibacteraceae bacterium]|nr:heme NO-binding domain-containing protein [Prolixibacteraceae bacterium]
MKGIIFTEFIEMVEAKFGMEITDAIIQNSQLKSGGIYTAVGTYDFGEMVSLVVNLSKKTKIEVPLLLNVFGEHLFGHFTKNYKSMIGHSKNTFDMLEIIDQVIHVEVEKLYPDAQLPKITTSRISENEMILDYCSERKMADLAYGLILGCQTHFKEEFRIDKEYLEADGSHVRFHLIRK